MKLLIYNPANLNFIETLDVSSDFEIILDTVIDEKSYFVVNNQKTIAKYADIVILHERSFFYIGSITNIEETSDKKTKITSVDYLSSLDFEIKTDPFNGNIGSEVIRLISREVSTSSDPHQNRVFLSLVNDAKTTGEIITEDDKLTRISDFLTQVYKEFKVRVETRLGIVGGRITHLKIVAMDISKDMTLSSTFPMIRELSVSDNKEISTNKITFIPSSENTVSQRTESYYLLSNNTISTDINSPLRITPVVEKKKIYKDSDVSVNKYIHKFRSGEIKTGSGSLVISNLSWYQSGATYIGFDSGALNRGVQIGSANNPQISEFYLELQISRLGSRTKVTEVRVTMAAASTSNTYKISVGGTTTGFREFSTTNNSVYSSGLVEVNTGVIRISLKATSGAMYLSQIEIFYQGNDGETKSLLGLATKELLKEEYMHNIGFKITKNNSVFVPLTNIHLGDKVRFIHGDKEWHTILSRIEMKGTLEDFKVTLGEQRVKLTEKLKIILGGK